MILIGSSKVNDYSPLFQLIPLIDYATEQTFLKGEVEIFRKQFERVVLVPRIVQGNRLPTSGGVDVDTSFAECFTLSKRIF